MIDIAPCPCSNSDVALSMVNRNPDDKCVSTSLPIFNLHIILYLVCQVKKTQYIVFVNAHLNRFRKVDRPLVSIQHQMMRIVNRALVGFWPKKIPRLSPGQLRRGWPGGVG
jgi:hypothetical protein